MFQTTLFLSTRNRCSIGDDTIFEKELSLLNHEHQCVHFLSLSVQFFEKLDLYMNAVVNIMKLVKISVENRELIS